MRFLRLAHDEDGPPRLSGRFNELYTRYGPVIYARCRQILKDRAAAEDITQETFLSAHHTLEKLRGERETLAWLYRTATNRCLNELRQGRHRPHLMESPPEPAGPAPEGRIEDQDLVARLAAELPRDLSYAAWLYHVDGHEQAEIAEMCGVSRRTIISRLGRFAEHARAFIERSQHDLAR